MDINPKDLVEMKEGEFRILLVGKMDAILSNQVTTKERLDSHSNQLKAIWGIGGLTGLIGAWMGHKGS